MADEKQLKASFAKGEVPASRAGNAVEGLLPLTRWNERPLYTFGLFLVFILARYIQVGARREIRATIRFEFLLGVSVILIAISLAILRPPKFYQSNSLIAWISLLFVTMVFHLPFAADKDIALMVFNDKVVKFALMTVCMVIFIESPKFLRWFLWVFLFSMFYITQEAVRGLIDGGLYWQNQGIMRLHGGVPLYAHPNNLGGVSVGPLPYVLYLFPIVKDWRLRLFLAITGVTSVVCVLYSGSRTAYLGTLFFIIFAWVRSKKRGKYLLVGVALGALTLSVLPQQYVERFNSIGGQEAEGNSKETRIVILEDAWAVFLEKPFGVGVASFPAVRESKFGRSQDTHNLYLQVATNLGFQGLFFFVGLIVAILWKLEIVNQMSSRYLFRLKRLTGQGKRLSAVEQRVVKRLSDDMTFLIAASKATSAFVVIRLVLGFFGMDLYEVYWWFAAGLAITMLSIASHMGVRLRKFESSQILFKIDGSLPGSN